MSLFDMNRLADLFVRPTRQVYKKSDLGRNQFVISSDKVRYYREDVSIPVGRERIECSIFSKYPKNELHLIDKCVIYLHCNTGCRVQGIPYVKTILAEGFAVVLFDFIGSGLSSGQYISLGYNETYDIQAVVSYLRKVNPNICIALWGRSMGAVAGIRYCTQNTHIKALILDSPFGSLRELALHLGNQKTWLPHFILNIFFNVLNPRIKEKSGVSLDDIDNHVIINNMHVPCLFITSQNDHVVKAQDVERLYNQYFGPKEILYISNDHHELRDADTIKQVLAFLRKTINRQTQVNVETPRSIQIKSLANRQGSILKNCFVHSEQR